MFKLDPDNRSMSGNTKRHIGTHAEPRISKRLIRSALYVYYYLLLRHDQLRII